MLLCIQAVYRGKAMAHEAYTLYKAHMISNSDGFEFGKYLELLGMLECCLELSILNNIIRRRTALDLY